MVRSQTVTKTPLLTQAQLLERASRDLDWPLLLDRLAGFTSSEPGARRLRALTPEAEWDAARLCMLRTEEALSLATEGNAIPNVVLPSLGDLIDRLERGFVATGVELRDLTLMLETARTLRQFAHGQRQTRPHLALHLATDPALEHLLERLSHAIDSDGTLRDRATPNLAKLRARVKDCRQEVVNRLKHLLEVHADLLQGHYFSERDGRYVLPFRADAHQRIEGTVIDTSASGGTLFVEPLELFPVANRLRIAISDVTYEELRILAELSALATTYAPALKVAENASIEADILAAYCRYALKSGALAILPEQTPTIELRAARHPLLVGQISEVVPNDLILASAQALIISGPNAGGKTVTLKAFGLFAMMARAGIPLTVAPGSRIGFFGSIYSEVGDSQSIVTSLSTFSAHVVVLASILEVSGPGTLVLLDEIAAGTDPEQGSALATAYLESLVGRNSSVVATTHYESLKELANRQATFRNAAVGFNVETMLPTFRILSDVAGPSTAFAVAKRFGIPSSVLVRAEELVPQFGRERESVLAQLAADREAARALRQEAARLVEEQRERQSLLDEEQASKRADFERQLEQEYRELLGRVRLARTELDNLRKRVARDAASPHELSRADIAQMDRTLDGSAHALALGGPVANAIHRYRAPQTNKDKPLALEDLRIGQTLYVQRLSATAQVVEVSRKGTLKVRVGNVVMQVALADVTVCPPSEAAPKPQSGQKHAKKSQNRSPQPSASPRTAPMRMTRNTLDLRGERVDAALDRVDAFVDELLRMGEPAGYVLHGHGTGALKQAVREHVRSMRHVAESGPAAQEDGGDAFTLLWLSD